MISHSKKFIFIHINKTGGTSVQKSLNEYWDHRPKKNHYPVKHVIESIGKKKYKKYFKFCIVRNPWDRLVSKYFWSLQKKCSIPKNMTFKQYIDNIEIFRKKEKRKRYDAFQSQLEWIKNGQIIDMDYIMKFENLQSDWNFIKRKLNIENNLGYHKNTNHEFYPFYYTDQNMIDAVRYIYKEDIDYFGYSFG